MKQLNRVLLFTGWVVLLTACSQPQNDEKTASATPAQADAFVAQVDQDLRKLSETGSRAGWTAATYITGDTQYLAAQANEEYLAYLKTAVEKAKRFDGLELSADTARAIKLLKLGTAMPAPDDPAELTELTQIVARMEATYGAGKYCPQGPESCKNLGELSAVLADPLHHDYQALTDAWAGWHTISRPMRADYQRFVELTNTGAQSLGYANLAQMWQSGYDMPPADFEREVDRIWTEVKPLYDALHCYVRDRLHTRYGDKVPTDGLIPAQLLGNMWAQEWSNIYPLVAPYPDVPAIDLASQLQARRDAKARELLAALPADATLQMKAEQARAADAWSAEQMVHSAEDFYTSLGIRKLPESFWQNSMFLRPRDRDVVCHASAWDIDLNGDVRIKMCIAPTDEDLATIYHELGHNFYYLAYNHQPYLFQQGANDGFHEAIGDTIVLSMTPDYLQQMGLLDNAAESHEALINRQMKKALDKVAFLPFARMMDQWRWDVFTGQITPENYNAGWWRLREQYQGISAPVPRSEADFDPGAKYHIPANTPYMRYFLADILQFQFYKAMCAAAGHDGPLYTCSFYGSKAAGEKFWAMMQQGASQPWPQTLKLLTGSEQLDAGALVEYFAPLQDYLTEQNAGKSCGW